MLPDAIQRILDAAAQMLIQRFFAARLVVEGDRLVEDVPIAALFDISRDAQHQPKRIVVEIASDGVVAAFGERLILVIRAAVFKLGRGDVEDAFAGARRNHMHKAKQVLIRVAEAHPAPDS